MTRSTYPASAAQPRMFLIRLVFGIARPRINLLHTECECKRTSFDGPSSGFFIFAIALPRPFPVTSVFEKEFPCLWTVTKA
jgi:hypothetical protein